MENPYTVEVHIFSKDRDGVAYSGGAWIVKTVPTEAAALDLVTAIRVVFNPEDALSP